MKEDNIQRLSLYLCSTDGWLPAEELATYLHISTRTIRNYIQEINNKTPSNPPIISSYKGYQWRVNDIGIYTMYELNHKSPQTSEDRYIYILRKLLKRKSLAIMLIQEMLAISYSTLNLDLVNIKTIIKHFDLTLHCYQDVLYLSGQEIDKRRLVIHCVYLTCSVDVITLKFIIKSYQKIDVVTISRILHDVLFKYNLHLDGYYQYELLLLVVNQLSRIKNQFFLKREEFIISEIEKYPDFQAAKELSALFGNACSCKYNHWEVAYMTGLILSKTNYQTSKIELNLIHYTKIKQQTLKCLKIAEQNLHIDFTQDNFPIQLSHFFLHMLVRQQLHLSISNLLTESLRSVHPLLLDISSNILIVFTQYYPLDYPELEVGTLALILGDYMYEYFLFESKLSCTLICPAFGNLVAKISAELASHLSNALNIKYIIDTTDIEAIPIDTDLVVSLLPIKNTPHTIVISPFPKPKDYKLIRREIQAVKSIRRQRQLAKYLNDYSQPSFFEMDHPFSSREEAIQYICRKLHATESVDEYFEEIVLRREQIDSTAFFNMIAIPHACCLNVKKNSLYVILNHKPMTWGNDRIYLLVLVAFQDNLLSDFHKLYSLLSYLFSKPKNILPLLQAKDYKSFLDIFPTLNLE